MDPLRTDGMEYYTELRHNRANREIVLVELRVPIVTRQGVRTPFTVSN